MWCEANAANVSILVWRSDHDPPIDFGVWVVGMVELSCNGVKG